MMTCSQNILGALLGFQKQLPHISLLSLISSPVWLGIQGKGWHIVCFTEALFFSQEEGPYDNSTQHLILKCPLKLQLRDSCRPPHNSERKKSLPTPASLMNYGKIVSRPLCYFQETNCVLLKYIFDNGTKLSLPPLLREIFTMKSGQENTPNGYTLTSATASNRGQK